MYEEQCPLQWRAGPTFMQHGSKALSSVSLSAEGCQNQAEAWVLWRCPIPCPLVSPESTNTRQTLSPIWGCHCPPHHSHPPGSSCWPFSPVLTSSIWPFLACQFSSMVCKCLETLSELHQAHQRAQDHLQSMSQMIWTLSPVHHPLSTPLFQ